MNKLFAAIIAAAFTIVSVAPAFAAEKKEAAKVDCKDKKNAKDPACAKKADKK